MKKIFLTIIFLGTCITMYCQHRHFSPDDKFTRQNIKRFHNVPFEVKLFNRSWTRLMRTYLLTENFSNRLSSISSFEVPTSDPDVLLSEYYDKINQLNASFTQQQETNNAMIDRGIRGLGDLAADYARENNITTKNVLADYLIKEVAIGTVQERTKKKNAEKLELQRSQLQSDLESNLSNEMSAIRDQILSENIDLRDKYLEAMVYEADFSKEKYYTSCYEYYNCFTNQINSEYYFKSSSWYKPKCITPILDYSTSINEGDYIDIANRKLNLYKKYNNELFKDGINIFLDASLSVNKQNPRAYFLKAQLETNDIDKLFYLYMAFKLDSGNMDYKRELDVISSSFNEDFFQAIKNNNINFISRSIDKGFHLGRESNGRSAIETAIDFDKDEILEMLINASPEEKQSLSENGQNLLFHACAVNALEVVKKLISLGVNPEFTDKNYSGLTALNVAELNNNQRIISYLAANYDINPALIFAKNSGEDDLDSLSSSIFKSVPSKLDEITSVNPYFRTKYFCEIRIQTNFDDAEIFLNNEKAGSGKAEIPDNYILDKYFLKVIKPGYSIEEKELELQSGYDLAIKISLQHTPKSLINYFTARDLGYEERTWEFYYKAPVGLKRETRRNRLYNQSLRDNAKDRAFESLRIYNEKISRELEEKNVVISEDNNRISQENGKLESERSIDLEYLKSEKNLQYKSNSAYSIEMDKTSLKPSENSDARTKKSKPILQMDQIADYAETDSANFTNPENSETTLSFRKNLSFPSDTVLSDENPFRSEYGVFTDLRDRKIYGWVKINNQVWMAENLAYVPSDEGSAWIYNSNNKSGETINNTANFVAYGVLYTYESAIESCPDGWRVPSDLEWSKLEYFLDNSIDDFNQMSYLGTTIGVTLSKSTPGSLYIRFGGKRLANGQFAGIGNIGSYWTSTSAEDSTIWVRQFQKNVPQIIRSRTTEKDGYSLRCIKIE